MRGGSNGKSRSDRTLAEVPTHLPQESHVGRRPGAYREGPAGASVRAPAPASLEDAVSSGYHRNTSQRGPEILLEAEPVSFILVDATPVPMEVPVLPTPEAPVRQPRPQRTRRTVAILVLSMLTIAVAAIVGGVAVTSKSPTGGVGGGSTSEQPSPSPETGDRGTVNLPTLPPSPGNSDGVAVESPKPSPTPSPTLIERFNATLPPPTIESLQDSGSPQYRAYNWTTQVDQVPKRDEPNDEERQLFRMTQRFALATLFYSMVGLESWVESTVSECQWGNVGNVTCTFDLQLFALDVEAMGYGGTIPPEIGLLTNLSSLRLFDNGLTSSLPSELGKLSVLEVIELSHNGLTSSIPAELGNLSALTYLGLYVNSLTSSIPPELGRLSALEVLDLSLNGLSSSIPAELGNLSSLTNLGLYFNSLTSSIPPELGRLSALTYLFLDSNALTSSIPTELGQLQDLEGLSLSNNDLTGTFPQALCYVGNNVFTAIDCSEVACTCCGCSR